MMIRDLKTLCLALMAALALGGMGASSASGQIAGGEFTSPEGYPAHVVGEDNPGTVRTFTIGAGIECAETSYTGTLGSGGSLDLTPDFTGCVLGGGAPATSTHNGCSYRITVGTGTGGTPEDWDASLDLVCPSGKQVEWHLYTNEAHTISGCTLEFPPQSNLGGLTLTDSDANSIVIEGTIPGFVVRAVGPGCTGGPTLQLPTAELHLNLTISATAPNTIDVGVTD